MSNSQLRQQARRMFNSELVPDHINRINQRKWVRSVLILGDKWLLAKKVERRASSS